MAYPMIALTTDGTSFACASISLTETGLAVLDDNGSRTGFVPYDSLAYVAPTEEGRVTEAPMQVRVEDGSTFGAASISETSGGVAVLDHSGSRVGFVPYDALTHVLPESKTGPTLPADATPPAGVQIDREDDGGSPVWEGDRERSDEHGEDAADESEAPEDADESADADEQDDDPYPNVDRSGNDNDSDPHPTPDDGDEADDESGGVWDDDPVEESEREADDGSEEESTEEEESDEEVLPCGCHGECTCGAHEEESGSEEESGAADEAENESDAPAAGAENGEREEAEESELVVEWSFGDDE